MTDDEKQALRNSMAGKKVSEMTEQERELFDQEFQYGLNDMPQIKPVSYTHLTLPTILRV